MSQQLDLRLPVSVHAPGIARRHIRRLTPDLDQELQENLALLVSELVSNSVRHPRHTMGTIKLKAWVVDTAVRVCVGDSGRGFVPMVVVPDPAAEGQRGLWLIDMLADNWGISIDDGTWSWFEIHGRASRPDAPQPLGKFLDAVTEWPLRSRELAWSMAAQLGPPNEAAPCRLAWTTPQCVAAILVPDHASRADANGSAPRRGLIDDHKGRWWLETLRKPDRQPSIFVGPLKARDQESTRT